MRALALRILGSRSRILAERTYSLECYLRHRAEQQQELRGVNDWMIRLFLWIRRQVDVGFFGVWLAELRWRRGLIESGFLRLEV